MFRVEFVNKETLAKSPNSMAAKQQQSVPYEKVAYNSNSDCLALDFESTETVHQWQQLPECDEFVGTRLAVVILVYCIICFCS